MLFPYLAPRAIVPAGLTKGARRFAAATGLARFGLDDGFPLGLVRHRRSIDVPAELIAWPRLGRLTPAGLQLARHSDLASSGPAAAKPAWKSIFMGCAIGGPATAAAGFIGDRPPGGDRSWSASSTPRGGTTWLCLSICFSAAADRRERFGPRPRKVETALSLAATLVWPIFAARAAAGCCWSWLARR